MIKQALPSDLDALFGLCEKAHAVSCYNFIDYDEALAKKHIAGCILSGFAYFNEHGLLLATVRPFWFNQQKTIAGDLIFWTDGHAKTALLLMEEYIAWASEKADYTALSVSIGGDLMHKAERFYKKYGFNRVGGHYVRGF